MKAKQEEEQEGLRERFVRDKKKRRTKRRMEGNNRKRREWRGDARHSRHGERVNELKQERVRVCGNERTYLVLQLAPADKKRQNSHKASIVFSDVFNFSYG